MAREEAPVDRLGIGNHPQAQAGRSAAVRHGLAHLDRDKPADRAVARGELQQPGPDPIVVFRFEGKDQRHPALGKGNELGVEQIGRNGIGETHGGRRHLDDLHLRQQAAQRSIESARLGKGLLMGEQDMLVRDRDDVIVERASSDSIR